MDLLERTSDMASDHMLRVSRILFRNVDKSVVCSGIELDARDLAVSGGKCEVAISSLLKLTSQGSASATSSCEKKKFPIKTQARHVEVRTVTPKTEG
jgi:hypothetical protein